METGGGLMAGVIINESDYLMHYGIKRKSGRYPWGSGADENTRSRDFLSMVDDLRKEGMTNTEIARAFNMSTTDLRATTTIARNQQRAAQIATAQRLKTKGMSNGAIATQMGLPGESSVRALLDPGAKVRTDQLQTTAQFLKDQVADKGYVQVGAGVELYTGNSRTQFDTALSMLKSEGYVVENIQVDQLGTGNKTLVKVLAPEGTTYRDIVTNKDQIKLLSYNKDPVDDSPKSIEPPLSIDSKRVGINYSEKNAKGEEIGGGLADGVVYVRRGVDDVSLGGAQYAQVRVAVDGTHYIKGMAVYKDDLPDGVDLVFNTNKMDTGNKLDALKGMKDDPEDPFGAVTRQIVDHNNKPKSAMNIVNEEGDWGNWSKSLASQMLSKQKPTLAKEQLDKTYDAKKKELDEILSLTNPAVRAKLLQSYSDDVDSSSVHLKAAAMPRQATQVIMPVSKLKDTEVYAPNFRDGERVALVRYPHGGTFEIPELTVNNRNPEAIELLGKAAKDAIGIHPRVAERLSGADFDGDTVLVIPNNSGKVKSTPALEGLKNFDPKVTYAPYDGMKTIDGGTYNAKTGKVDFEPGKNASGKKKQTEMGKVSNLITDMTIKGANTQEIARAVRHSMVVIDAEKHKLNYKQSYEDNGIAQLKQKYQGGADRGATTLISRTTSQVRVNQRKMSYDIDPVTGEKKYRETGESYVNAKGKVITKMSTSQQGAETRNAHDLSSGTPIEKIYADHSNRLKSLANNARLEMINTKPIPMSPSAKAAYAPEVTSLNAKLNMALRNAPLERQAQLVANARVKAKRDANPDMGNDELKKLKGKELLNARASVGAGKTLVDITDREWEAIQAGAISNHRLEEILNNSDLDRVKQLATPRKATVMTDAKQARARQLLDNGRTPSEVADILGVPLSTLTSSIE
jgi:hypothetical protein